MRATSVEPTIAEMLSDPIVGLLMEHDDVTVEEVRRLLEEARHRLKGDAGCPSEVAAPGT